MASSTSSTPRTWTYRVFTSFHGPDVRKTLLSHVRKQFNCNGISMFDDQGIERSQLIAPALTRAIRESRVSIVVLSKNYASSRWCLDELLEILKCKENMGQIVMTVFYGVDPSNVRNQTGEFGNAFNETCARHTEEERRRWTKALTDVGNIAGEHFLNWDNESNMIEKIARDVSNKLNTRISWNFEDMVGIEAHLMKMQSLLHLDDEDGAMIVGICGPAGIGKTTIARALHSRLSSSFELTCFMENIRGSCDAGLDDYGSKLCLQEQFLSKILNQNGMRISHLGAIHERLCDLKAFIVLDDVDALKQLEALADETRWFGSGSRIIVTTEDKELLERHGINNTYHVDFPTNIEAYQIFCRFAFRQRSGPYGFEKLVERVTRLCSNLPLGLRVMGSSLRGKKEDDWEIILHRLENSLDRDIEGVLRVGYDNLHENDQSLFLHIAFFFNYQEDDHVKSMLADSIFDVELGLKTLAYRSLIQISTEGKVVMHKLLQQVGRQAVQRQEPWKRQILIDVHEICDVLETDSGSRGSVTGISFDISTIHDGVYISAGAFKRMRNLRFLSVYKKRFDTVHVPQFDRNVRVHVPEGMDFPPRLRLLDWDVYPGKCLPRTFCPEYLVEFSFRYNQLEMLWEGTQPLANLKKMDLLGSSKLKSLPDLSNATNLETLSLIGCQSLVKLSSSIGNLHKLKNLLMVSCKKVQNVQTHWNLASLEWVSTYGCCQLRKLLEISRNIKELEITDTMLEQVPESIRHWSRLQTLNIFGSFTRRRYVDEKFLNHSGTDIEKIPDWIKDLQGLKSLRIKGCPKLGSLPKLPRSLRTLSVYDCKSLDALASFPVGSQIENLYIGYCPKLASLPEVPRSLRRLLVWLPGRTVPAEFDYRAIGNSLTIHSDVKVFRICVVISPKHQMIEVSDLVCRIRLNKRCSIDKNILEYVSSIRTEHLFISQYRLLEEDGWLELENNEISFEFSTRSKDMDIIECGVQIWTDKELKQKEQPMEATILSSGQISDENLSDGAMRD